MSPLSVVSSFILLFYKAPLIDEWQKALIHHSLTGICEGQMAINMQPLRGCKASLRDADNQPTFPPALKRPGANSDHGYASKILPNPRFPD